VKYRHELLLFGLVLVICVLAVRAIGEEPKPLKPGDEVKSSELEAAKLGKLKAQIERIEAQKIVLQQQFAQLQAQGSETQAKIDELVKAIITRVKAEHHVEVVYDQRAGEDGTFRVAAPPPTPETKVPAAGDPKK
jgi:uncharacterized protein (DUF342 family)